MGLYERLMRLNGDKIRVHQFNAIMAEVARGRLTPAQANAKVSSISASALSGPEQAEAQTLLDTITGQITDLLKLARAKEIEDVLSLADSLVPGYDTVAAVKTRLGV